MNSCEACSGRYLTFRAHETVSNFELYRVIFIYETLSIIPGTTCKVKSTKSGIISIISIIFIWAIYVWVLLYRLFKCFWYICINIVYIYKIWNWIIIPRNWSSLSCCFRYSYIFHIIIAFKTNVNILLSGNFTSTGFTSGLHSQFFHVPSEK